MVIVTGAGGTVGSEVARRLAAAGTPYKAGYRSAAKLEKARRAGVPAVPVDFMKPETLREAFAGADRIFLLSGNGPDQTAVEGLVVRVAKEAGARHVVKQSVWGSPEEAFTFARSHRPVEKAIEASGLAWTFLRPNGFYQNVLHLMAGSIRSQDAFFMPAGGAPISHVDARDIAEVAVAALTRPGHEGKAYDVSGPEALTYVQMAQKLSAALGRTILYVEITAGEYRRGMLQSGMSEWMAEAVLDLMRYYAEGRASRVSPDVRLVLGREPLSFDQFVRDHAADFRRDEVPSGSS